MDIEMIGDHAEHHLNKAEPPSHSDLLLREWPTDGRTEVIITQGDFYRLEETEYLNDTLTEFGLYRI
jgi:Ulp1 family protease